MATTIPTSSKHPKILAWDGEEWSEPVFAHCLFDQLVRCVPPSADSKVEEPDGADAAVTSASSTITPYDFAGRNVIHVQYSFDKTTGHVRVWASDKGAACGCGGDCCHH